MSKYLVLVRGGHLLKQLQRKEQVWGCGWGWRNLMLRVKIRAKFVALENSNKTHQNE